MHGEKKVVKDSEWTDIMDDLRMTPAQRKKLLPPIEKRQSELQKEINKWDAEIKKNQKSAANNFLNRKTPQGKKWAQEHMAKQSIVKSGISVIPGIGATQKSKGKGR